MEKSRFDVSPNRWMLTAEHLRELLHYDPETGKFSWRVKHRGRQARDGCGYKDASGRRYIRLEGKLYGAARLAWLYMTGEWPKHYVDHIDVDPSNDKWANLRDVPHQLNQQNRRKPMANNTTGYLGVTMDRAKGKYMAQIGGSKRKFLGYFDDPAEAHAAYVKAKRERHEGCTL